MSGRLEEVSLPELMQLLATGGRTVRIVVTHGDGQSGELILHRGQVMACSFASLRGEEAFFALYEPSGGQFEVFRVDAARVRRSTLALDWQALVFEAARRIDEAGRDSASLDSRKVVRLPTSDAAEALFTVMPEEPEELDTPHFERLFEEAMRAYIRRDLESARALFLRCRDLRPHDLRVKANLERLSSVRPRR